MAGSVNPRNTAISRINAMNWRIEMRGRSRIVGGSSPWTGWDHILTTFHRGSYSLSELGDPFRPFYGPAAQRGNPGCRRHVDQLGRVEFISSRIVKLVTRKSYG